MQRRSFLKSLAVAMGVVAAKPVLKLGGEVEYIPNPRRTGKSALTLACFNEILKFHYGDKVIATMADRKHPLLARVFEGREDGTIELRYER